MKNKGILLTAMTAALGVSASYGAVVITAVNSNTGYAITGAEVAGYRSTSVAKTYDVGTTPDNAYGTDGYMVFGGTNSNNNGAPLYGANTVSSNPSFVTTIAAGAQFSGVSRQTSYPKYDNASLGISATVTDFGATAVAVSTNGTTGTWNELLTFTIDGTASSFRLGIMAGNENTSTGAWDPTGLRVSFDGGTATAITDLAHFQGQTGMVFFDIAVTDGSTGTFSIESQRRAANGGSSLAGITFDVIPEPSTSALMGLGMAGLLLRRRRG